jgi:hypothetical protein
MKRRTSSWIALFSALAALFGCDPQTAAECENGQVGAGKADDAEADPTAEVEALVQTYFESWQRADWRAYRDVFASRIHVDAGFGVFEDPDAFTEVSMNGHPFTHVELVDVFAHPMGATIVYTAIDSVTKDRVRVSELIAVGLEGDAEYDEERLVIVEITAVIATTPAPRDTFDAPRESLAFAPLDPNQPDGLKLSLLWGDLSTASGFLLRVPAGSAGFPHTHSAGYHAVVLEGTIRNGRRIEDAPDLAPGSYWSQAGNATHTTACRSEVDCLSLVMLDGPFDVTPK